LIDSKNGWIRGAVLGGQYNFSGRNVIVLDPSLKINEIDVGYKYFLVAFSGNLIKRIVKEKGWTITKAYNFIKSKFQKDDYILSIMNEIIKEESAYLILNRNPTLSPGSIIEMKIRRIKEDGDDVTLSLPSAILPPLNADLTYKSRSVKTPLIAGSYHNLYLLHLLVIDRVAYTIMGIG
jgi:DNA-directed RNA polymerase beta' subunit